MTESEVKYLKTVFLLAKSRDEVHSIDIASALGFSKASVSRAMKILKGCGYITMEPSGRISLTPGGYSKAKNIFECESIISGFLQQTLEIDDELSAKYSACVARIIDQETLNKMKNGTAAAMYKNKPSAAAMRNNTPSLIPEQIDDGVQVRDDIAVPVLLNDMRHLAQ